jgi:hypothetical protein
MSAMKISNYIEIYRLKKKVNNCMQKINLQCMNIISEQKNIYTINENGCRLKNTILSKLNALEDLQSVEYLISREVSIRNMIYEYDCIDINDGTDVHVANIKNLQKSVAYETKVLKKYKSMVPDEAVITNYKIYSIPEVS